MRKAYFRVAVVAALLAAGCGVGTTVGAVPDSLGAPGLTAQERAFLKSTAATARYRLKATTASATQAAATCTVSSTRDEIWFGAKHLTDGKPTSAWGPAASDEAPAITLDLGACLDVTALGIKMSGGATMTIEAMVDGAWSTVATGVTTAAGQLDLVEVAVANATAVRITFEGDAADLLVCDVAAWGHPCAAPTPAPSAAPSVAPSPLPSAEPTPTPHPTASPTPAPCCKAITGNGNIEAVHATGTFKFEINTPAGRVNFRGPDGGQAFLPILSAVCTDAGAIVTADADHDGTGDTTFVLVGEAQGNHLATVSCTIDGDLSLFPDFLTPVTAIQGSLNIFDDPDCDGTPN